MFFCCLFQQKATAFDISVVDFFRYVSDSSANITSLVWWNKATIDDVKKEIQKGSNVNHRDSVGRTPLMYAVNAKKNKEILQFLIDNGADVNQYCKKGKSVLEYGLYDKEIVEFLIQKGAKVGPDILLRNRSIAEYPEIVAILVENGANVNAIGEYDETFLQTTIHYADEKTVAFLLDLGADANAKNSFGETILMSSVFSKNPKIVELLLQHGAVSSINAGNEMYGNTALMLAARSGNLEIVKLLLRYGADVNAKNFEKTTPLMYAVENPEILTLLINSGAQINAVNSRGENALLLAEEAAKRAKDKDNYLKTIEILKKHQVDINAKDKDGKTALMLSFTKPDRIKILIEAGANVNLTDKNGNTPLMTAVYPVQHESIKLLLEAGANPNLQNNKGETALMRQFSKPETVELLINYNADVNIKDKFGRTALWYTIIFDKFESFKVLMKYRADVNTVANDGFTPLMAAAINGRTEMVKILLENGAARTVKAKTNKGKDALSLAKTSEIAEIIKKYY